MIVYIIGKIYDYRVEKDEIISELYIHIQEDNWHKLRQFDFRSKLTTWISVVASRFFIKKRNSLKKNIGEDAMIEKGYDPFKSMILKMDMENTLENMQNRRYRDVLFDLFVEDMEPEEVAEKMKITVANLYNLKHRALQQFAKILKKETGYGS